MLLELLILVSWIVIRGLPGSPWSFAVLVRSMRGFLMHSIFAGIVVVAQTRSHLITALSARFVFSVAHCLTRLVNFVGLNALTCTSFVVL